MSRDSLASWLRSVKEAEAYQDVFRASLAKAAKHFYQPQTRSMAKVDPKDIPKMTNLPGSEQAAHGGDMGMDMLVETTGDLELKTADFDPG
jgi:hypothetical protein